MHTEEQAKKLLCPYAIDLEDVHYTRCLASGCMAWRWAGLRNDDGDFSTLGVRVGYCGLAGQPS